MKALPLILSYLAGSLRRRNVRLLLVLVVLFVALVAIYSVSFHVLMDREGQSHSWATSVYWTLVTMTTLGFGDITFQSDAGRLFSVVVLLSGSIFLLVLLPFTFIQFVFVPWMSAREAGRAPRQLPADTEGHLVLTDLGPIEGALVRRAEQAGVPYVLLVGELDEALRLHDRGYRVMVGALDDPASYRAARVASAALVAATRSDTTNTNVTFTVREISATVPVVATASSSASIDILELAGADQVLQLGEMLGSAMAARTLGPDGRSHLIGAFAGLQIAEAAVAGTDLVGRTLVDARLRAELGVGVVGLWDRGRFAIAAADTVLTATTVLILAGTASQLAGYDDRYAVPGSIDRPVVVIGGGRVGRAAARAFEAEGVRAVIVEQRAERVRDPDRYVVGDAADRTVLEEAGISEASAVIVTTHDDDVNVYLSIYCRRLRPDVRVIARANLDRNVSTLYRAGADAVLSYASTGATAVWNAFRPDDTLLVAEGLNVFRRRVPMELAGRTLAEVHLRATTGCNVVAIELDDELLANPEPTVVLPAGADLLLIGDAAAEERFAAAHPSVVRGLRRRRTSA